MKAINVNKHNYHFYYQCPKCSEVDDGECLIFNAAEDTFKEAIKKRNLVNQSCSLCNKEEMVCVRMKKVDANESSRLYAKIKSAPNSVEQLDG